MDPMIYVFAALALLVLGFCIWMDKQSAPKVYLVICSLGTGFLIISAHTCEDEAQAECERFNKNHSEVFPKAKGEYYWVDAVTVED